MLGSDWHIPRTFVYQEKQGRKKDKCAKGGGHDVHSTCGTGGLISSDLAYRETVQKKVWNCKCGTRE